ncbi:hypothetical protein MalM25_27760 [Planctomycetes bacterium MalM25]|nr:hypothetical protein MalM25_27760 [Planctomycetes bacterium MalM25]
MLVMKTSPLATLLLTLCWLASQAAADEVLYQSATLGTTGITEFSPENPGNNVGRFNFTGGRFELTQPVITSRIGGHFFVSRGAGNFFGALVALTGPNDFPDSSDLSTPDVLGNTLLTFPDPSDEVFGELELALDPGWYGVVFGSGLFGATGAGGAVRNNADLPDGGLIGWSASVTGDGWFDLVPGVSPTQQRVVVRGFQVPEPTSFGIASLVMLATYYTAAISRSR